MAPKHSCDTLSAHVLYTCDSDIAPSIALLTNNALVKVNILGGAGI